MPAFPYKAGSVLIPSGTYHDPTKKHLFIICTDECAEGKFLLVPVSTWINDLCDSTCRLSIGDHPFIIRDSYVFYRKSRIEARAVLEAGVQKALFVVRQDVNASLLERVRSGVCASIQTPRGVKRYFGCR